MKMRKRLKPISQIPKKINKQNFHISMSSLIPKMKMNIPQGII